jgi:DNA recombination protein RmuC
MVSFFSAILIAAIAVAVGGFAVWFFLRERVSSSFERGKGASAVEIASLTERVAALQAEVERLREVASRLEGELRESGTAMQAEVTARAAAEERGGRVGPLEQQLKVSVAETTALKEKNAQLLAEIEAERKLAAERLTHIEEAQAAMTAQFQNIANKIFEEKGVKFVEQNRQSLDVLLKPLDTKIREFQAKVEEVYVNETKERFSLQGEIKRLVELNVKLSDDAVNLTNALKGDSKSQGNWGELILERVLEKSGLQKGREYDVQVSVAKGGDDERKRAQPDVVVRLPEGKHIVIDSKVSLKAYEQYASADSDDERKRFLREHVDSVRRHVSFLSAQDYSALYGLKSLDFVLMFMPIEPAFRIAAESDNDLFADAFEQNIMMVGPSTLLISMKTIASIWRYEYQNRNAQELARQCGALYDKFVGFVADIEDIGKKLDLARGSYDDAFGKLKTGKGNLVRSVERIRQLGVKPSKLLPAPLVEAAAEPDSMEEADEAAKRG